MNVNSENLITRVERINLLMDLYGNLLTEKQRRFLELHYCEDLSFGEIATQYNVSRQAIYGREARGTLERLTDGRYAVAPIEKARIERRERLAAELAKLQDA